MPTLARATKLEAHTDEATDNAILVSLCPARLLDAERPLHDLSDGNVVKRRGSRTTKWLALAKAILQPLDVILKENLNQFIPGIALITFRLFFRGKRIKFPGFKPPGFPAAEAIPRLCPKLFAVTLQCRKVNRAAYDRPEAPPASWVF